MNCFLFGNSSLPSARPNAVFCQQGWLPWIGAVQFAGEAGKICRKKSTGMLISGPSGWTKLWGRSANRSHKLLRIPAKIAATGCWQIKRPSSQNSYPFAPSLCLISPPQMPRLGKHLSQFLGQPLHNKPFFLSLSTHRRTSPLSPQPLFSNPFKFGNSSMSASRRNAVFCQQGWLLWIGAAAIPVKIAATGCWQTNRQSF